MGVGRIHRTPSRWIPFKAMKCIAKVQYLVADCTCTFQMQFLNKLTISRNRIPTD